MAVYKVIQDVEAEDKLLGPLTLKAFIYAIIAGTLAFINFKLLFIASPIKWVFILAFLPPMILFGVLASPLGRDQPTEVWLLSRIRYFLKPRLRIWDQEGMDELVTVTAPKKIEVQLTKDLSQREVHSRLRTLASTLDTRGWAIKNVDLNLNIATPEEEAVKPDSDRLVANAGYTQEQPVVDIHAADDIMDERNNPTAQKFDTMMKQAESKRKTSVLQTLRGLIDDRDEAAPKHKTKKHKDQQPTRTDTKDLPATRAALSAMKQETAAARARRRAEEDAETAIKLVKAREKFSSEFDAGRKKPNPYHQVVGVPGIVHKEPAPPAPQPTPVTAARQAVNMELAQSGSAFSVSTLAGLANRQPQAEQTGPSEITISLH